MKPGQYCVPTPGSVLPSFSQALLSSYKPELPALPAKHPRNSPLTLGPGALPAKIEQAAKS
ncbi:hypothetical protein [Flaviaesturariibacter terrae]